MGEKVLIGHEISENFLDLEFNPRDHKNNLIVDLAHNNFINFDLMVLNNYRNGCLFIYYKEKSKLHFENLKI